MRRLPAPNFSAKDCLDICKNGIGTVGLRNRIEEGIEELSQEADFYATQASKGELFTIVPLPKNANENSVVAARITKKEFITLYEYYLRNGDKPGRAIYDSLLLSAGEKCPFCGGIGRPRNLDHFMPKAFFPQFSIVPVNLVPACRDCNMDGKGQAYAEVKNKQIIHPYLDHDHFFIEQWIRALVVPGNPCSVEYFIHAPVHWNSVDQQRVASHFNDFELAKRYSIQAAEELSTIISIRKGSMRTFPPEEFSRYLSSFREAPLFVNHWKMVLYQCLASDEWFCSFNF